MAGTASSHACSAPLLPSISSDPVRASPTPDGSHAAPTTPAPRAPPVVAAAHQRRALLSPRRTRSCRCCASADVGKVWARRAYPYDEIEPRWQALWEEHPGRLQAQGLHPRHVLLPKPLPSVPAAKSHASTYVLGCWNNWLHQSDVYNSGIVLLELLKGMKTVDNDCNLHQLVTCTDMGLVQKVFQLALLCTKQHPIDRPRMHEEARVLLWLMPAPVV
ncbi:unnamed protein product [Triticum turgidum subsp. durum]|uniref:Serine-threonine/tyrosine-protein kinase catalytic domain-containing protein n=1 Tax=Triticum turgidum subsp. durum TaxID=4567 RepID=A0A9R1BDG9_TRITD|nr:unnamed protein product [Triticum turgidum subsp. durum]